MYQKLYHFVFRNSQTKEVRQYYGLLNSQVKAKISLRIDQTDRSWICIQNGYTFKPTGTRRFSR